MILLTPFVPVAVSSLVLGKDHSGSFYVGNEILSWKHLRKDTWVLIYNLYLLMSKLGPKNGTQGYMLGAS